MMGVCFDCLVTVDDVPNQQALPRRDCAGHAHPHAARRRRACAVRGRIGVSARIHDVAVIGVGPPGSPPPP